MHETYICGYLASEQLTLQEIPCIIDSEVHNLVLLNEMST